METRTTAVDANPSWEMELRIISIFCRTLGVDSCQVRPEDRFFDVTAMDSLDLIDLVMGLEAEFQVSMSDKWCEQAFTNPQTMTFRDLAVAIAKLQQSAAPPTKPSPLAAPVPEQA